MRRVTRDMNSAKELIASNPLNLLVPNICSSPEFSIGLGLFPLLNQAADGDSKLKKRS